MSLRSILKDCSQCSPSMLYFIERWKVELGWECLSLASVWKHYYDIHATLEATNKSSHLLWFKPISLYITYILDNGTKVEKALYMKNFVNDYKGNAINVMIIIIIHNS